MHPETISPTIPQMSEAEKAELEAHYWANPIIHSELAPLAGSALPTSTVEIYLITTELDEEIK